MGHVYRFDIFSLDPPRREAYKFAAGAFRGGVSRKVQGMPRVARVVIVDVAHHVTQRGNGRQFILASDTERLVYLDLLHQALREQPLSVLGYCLMSNHVHLVAVPRQAEVLAATFQQVHGRYAAYWNVAHATSGHVWQGRFYSCPMDPGHLWTALRYVELNPVRAGMVAEAAAWPWSSAAAHCGTADPDACLDMSTWRKAWSETSWRPVPGAGGGGVRTAGPSAMYAQRTTVGAGGVHAGARAAYAPALDAQQGRASANRWEAAAAQKARSLPT